MGWSVLPLCPASHLGVGRGHRGCDAPGKRPFFPDREHRSGEWKEFQTRRATADELRRWWASNQHINVGAAMGPVSGLFGIDVDDEEGEELLVGLSGGDLPETLEYTTGKGRRLLYALPPGVEIGSNSFKRPGTEIEILRLMGRGGQVVLPPSVHRNGAVYRWREGHGPGEIEPAPVPQWLRAPIEAEGKSASRPADGELITEGGRNNYLTTLAGAMRKRGADEYVIGVALKACNETRCDPPLADAEVETIARSVCRYAPDEFTGVTIKIPEPGRVPPPADPEGYQRKFKWSSELTAPPKADEWIWKGYLPRAGITLLSALWKAGKTTLLAHLLRALGSEGEFLGLPIKASKVLYVSEEGEAHWVRRRDDLKFGDHAGFYLQPFASKPDALTWIAFIGSLRDDVLAHKFDLIVFDTLAKLWPVVEENDAGSVDAALMPLWELTKAGAGVLMIHHLRKSGGQDYTASRGSGALSAFPDILIELTRFEAGNGRDRKRVLKAKGRYDETPDELVIELTADGYRHVRKPEDGVGADGLVVVPEPVTEEDRLLYILTHTESPWCGADEIRERLKMKGWGFRAKDVNIVLWNLYERKEIAIRGLPRNKTEPREYALASRVDAHSTPGSQAE